MRDRKPIGPDLRQGADRQNAVSGSAQAFRRHGDQRMRSDRKQDRPVARQDEDRSLAVAPRRFAPLERQPPRFALELRHGPAGGMLDDRS